MCHFPLQKYHFAADYRDMINFLIFDVKQRLFEIFQFFVMGVYLYVLLHEWAISDELDIWWHFIWRYISPNTPLKYLCIATDYVARIHVGTDLCIASRHVAFCFIGINVWSDVYLRW